MQSLSSATRTSPGRLWWSPRQDTQDEPSSDGTAIVSSAACLESSSETIARIDTVKDEIPPQQLPTLPRRVLDPLAILQRELACPICLEIMSLPVTVACGHSFCRYCIGYTRIHGRLCPLCRQALGSIPAVSTVLQALIAALHLPPSRRASQGGRDETNRQTKVAVDAVPDESKFFDQIWWEKFFKKPCVPTSVFLRAFLFELGHTLNNVFSDDFCSSIISWMSKRPDPSPGPWVTDLSLAKEIFRCLALDKSDLEESLGRTQRWVATYILDHPEAAAKPVPGSVTLQVIEDRIHHVDPLRFFSNELEQHLPWDIGRDELSFIHLSHTSVSLHHFILVPVQQTKNRRMISTGDLSPIAIVDCRSYIGTMVKLPLHFDVTLEDGDTFHFGDRIELQIFVFPRDLPVEDVPNQAVTSSGLLLISRLHCNRRLTAGGRCCDGCESNIEKWIWLDAEEGAGVVLGRGPTTTFPYKKITVTNCNGYVSRDHAMVTFNQNRWTIRDTSTVGTFLKLEPFGDPFPLPATAAVKAGQCKIEFEWRQSNESDVEEH